MRPNSNMGRNLTFKVRRPSSRQFDLTLKRKKERCQLLPHYITWPLLIAVSTACVALVTFHLWFTWHLQRKVEALQSRVETLSTLDLEELRVQLRNLYDLYDGGSGSSSTELKNNLLEQQHVFAEKNQVKQQQPILYHIDFSSLACLALTLIIRSHYNYIVAGSYIAIESVFFFSNVRSSCKATNATTNAATVVCQLIKEKFGAHSNPKL